MPLPLAVCGEVGGSGCLPRPIDVVWLCFWGDLVLMVMGRRAEIWLGPLEQAHGQAQIPVHPGPDRHGTARIIKALPAVPIKNISVRFAPVAGKTSWNAILSNA
jgi:hypothetical protein